MKEETVHLGLALVGLCLNRFSTMEKGGKVPGILHADVLKSYEGLLSTGKSDYEAITDRRRDDITILTSCCSNVISKVFFRGNFPAASS